MAANGTKQNNAKKNESDAATQPQQNGAANASRRERKQKFDVKQLLNIRGGAGQNKATRATPEAMNNHKTRRSGRVRAAAVANGTPTTASPKKKEELGVGKRERKRKKFWDEETSSKESPSSSTSSGTPPAPKIRKSSESRKSSVVTSANGKSKSASQPVATCVKRERKASAENKPNNSSDGKRQANGKVLEYLRFDFTSDPGEIAKQMVEGVNIPGPGVPIPVDSSSLPEGWEKRVIQRGIGVTKGKWDVFILNPQGKSFRSKMELQKHFEDKKLPMKSEDFDFSLDDNLKKLRQIWKQHIVLPRLQEKEAEASAVQSQETAIVTDVGETSVDGDETEIGVESETGQGVRCSVNRCGKLFRNERLLQAHVKHYHPKTFESYISTHADGHQMARFEDDLSNPSSPKSTSHTTTCHENSVDADKRKTERKRKFSSEKQSSDKRQRTVSAGVDVDEAAMAAMRRGPGRPVGYRKKHVSLSGVVEEHDDVFRTSERSRNDSILSVGSETDEALTPTKVTTTTTTVLPTTPPTFRVSKRRQAQLKKKILSPVLRMNKVEDTPDGKCYMEEFMQFLNSSGKPVAAPQQGDSTPGIGGLAEGSATSSYPPSEMDASVASEHLTNEEVVNCTCKRVEEDGLMIQCDICLCWQHGYCLGLDEEDQVPEKYVCQICRDPPGGRTNTRFALDQDWLKEGKLVSVSLPGIDTNVDLERERAFKKLSELMADLSNLSKVLHSLRLKLYVASENNSKVFMWSSPWEKSLEEEEEERRLLSEQVQDQSEHLMEHAIPPQNSTKLKCSAEEESLLSLSGPVETDSMKLESSDSKHTNHHSLSNNEEKPLVNGDAIKDEMDKVKSEVDDLKENCQEGISSTDKKSNTEGSDNNESSPSPHSTAAESSQGIVNGGNSTIVEIPTESNENPADEDALDSLDPSIIPSVSEVERLLPIIQASLQGEFEGQSGGGMGSLSLPPTNKKMPTLTNAPIAPIIIPEQKRIDKDECRLNLLRHIEYVQSKVNEVFEQAEKSLDSLEKGEDQNKATLTTSRLSGKAKIMTVMLLQDLGIARKIIGAV